MFSDTDFHCPVCRAKQTLAETCRRCKADLSLVMQVYRRLAYLRAERGQANAQRDTHRVQAIEAELLWLSPNKMRDMR